MIRAHGCRGLRWGIRQQLYVVQIVSLLAFLVIGWVSVRQIQKNAAERTNLYAEISFNQTVQTLEAFFDSLGTTTQSFAYTYPTQRLLQRRDGVYPTREIYRTVASSVRFLLNTNENVIDIALMCRDGQLYMFGDRLNHELADYARLYEQTYGGERKRGLYTGFLGKSQNRYPDCFLYILPVYSSLPGESFGKRMGLCMMLCRVRPIESAMRGALSDNNHLRLSIGEREVLSEMGITQAQTRPLSVNTHGFGLPGWELTQTVYEDGAAAAGRRLQYAQIMGIPAACALMLLMMWIIHRNFTAPIEQIQRQLGEITAAPDEGRSIVVGPKNELSVIAEGINRMLRNLQAVNQRNLEGERNLLQAEILKNKLQLSALQSQINPHFLYNTLACIRGMAIESGLGVIASIASNMAAMFRYSIRGDTFVRLRDELAIVEKYLGIMNLRMDNRFHVAIDVGPEMLDRWIVKMTLQPLVENAVFHGIECIDRKGELRISAVDLDPGRYALHIRDNGVGIPYEALAYLNQRLKAGGTAHAEETVDHGMGIGMANINQKIKLLIGDEYGLTVESIEGVETLVIVTLPVLTEKPNE